MSAFYHPKQDVLCVLEWKVIKELCAEIKEMLV